MDHQSQRQNWVSIPLQTEHLFHRNTADWFGRAMTRNKEMNARLREFTPPELRRGEEFKLAFLPSGCKLDCPPFPFFGRHIGWLYLGEIDIFAWAINESFARAGKWLLKVQLNHTLSVYLLEWGGFGERRALGKVRRNVNVCLVQISRLRWMRIVEQAMQKSKVNKGTTLIETNTVSSHINSVIKTYLNDLKVVVKCLLNR